MIKVSLNIGYKNQSLHGFPFYYEFENSREFTDFIRREAYHIFLWKHDNHISGSPGLQIYAHIEEDLPEVNGVPYYMDWNFKITCRNIREFKPYFEMPYDEFESFKASKQREEKIDDLLKI